MVFLKTALCRLEQEYLIRRGIRRFRGELRHGLISMEAITEIWLGWGNTSYSASPDVLYELVYLACEIRDQVIIECGGGVSTLLLSLVSEKTRARIITIEHDDAWCQALRRIIAVRSHGVVQVRHAPLVPFEGYEWYRLTALAGLGSVGLVFCDRPPGQTPGGRIGIVEHLAGLLPESAIIVIDDSNRPQEKALSERWAADFGLSSRSFVCHRGRGFDILSGAASAISGEKNGPDHAEQALHSK